MNGSSAALQVLLDVCGAVFKRSLLVGCSRFGTGGIQELDSRGKF